MTKILKIKPFYSEKIWGYEDWILSTHKNGHSIVQGKDINLIDYIGKELPILNKIIKADDTLSIQVHPGDEFAKKYENDNGKTECWYILDAKESATLVCGIKKGQNKESFEQVIKQGNVEEYLERINVKAGDMIYIPAGTVHAIEGGLKLIEVQQSSDVTYRLHDWGRDREIHIDKSLQVIDYEGRNNGGKIEDFKKLKTPYFTVEKIEVNSQYKDTVNSEGFHSYTVIDGIGEIVSNEERLKLEKEETIFIPSGIDYTIVGNIELLKSYV